MQGLGDEHDNPAPGCRQVRVARRSHCARGPSRCPRCQAAHAAGPVWELVAPDANPLQAARQVVQFRDEGPSDDVDDLTRDVHTGCGGARARRGDA